MNQWQFDEAHIDSWAQFSGDFNPIHFDLGKARQAGSDAVIVHGMLPLLFVKKEVWKKAAHDGMTADWLSLNCRLKSPLPRNAPHAFAIHELDGRGKFSIRSLTDPEELVRGTYTMRAPVPQENARTGMLIETPEAIERLAQFRALFPEIDELWIAVDAMVFSYFLSSEMAYEAAKSMGMAGGATDQNTLMKQALTIQTSHAVSVCPHFAAQRLSGDPEIRQIDIRLGEPISIKNSDSELVGSHTADVYVNGRFSMQIEIGLMLKLLN
jgi:hypothetical protein